MKKRAFLVFALVLAAIVVNSPWFWNAYAAIFDDKQYRLPMAQLSLSSSDSGDIASGDLGPGVFTISIESKGLAVADGVTKEVKVYIKKEGEEHEIVARGVVYNGTMSAEPFTFPVSLLQSRKSGNRIGCRWEGDPSIKALTFSVRRAY
jgi:hypothetical protein